MDKKFDRFEILFIDTPVVVEGIFVGPYFGPPRLVFQPKVSGLLGGRRTTRVYKISIKIDKKETLCH